VSSAHRSVPYARLLAPFLLLTPLLLPASADASAHGQNRRSPALSAASVLLLNTEGRVLYAKNADVDRAPASLVKLMTLYLALDDIAVGRARLDDVVTVTSYAALTPRFRMGLQAGERLPLRVLLEGVAIASANDAATAVAEYLAGDEAGFVARMNAKARELGLEQTSFGNAHGLPDPAQRSTARDLAVLTARLLADHPMARALLGGQTFIYRGRVHSRQIPLFSDPWGVQALKTGFTREAGFNLAVSAWREGRQFVMIVLGAESRALSFMDGKKLLKFGFVLAGLEAPPPPPKPRPVRQQPARTRPAGKRN
jgi:D-alanyl-D-alanine carboxypeptidase